MRDHDMDGDGLFGARPRADQDQETTAATDREVGHAVESGRPEALGPGGLLQLQQAAGNQGVRALIAQRQTAGAEAADAEPDSSPVTDVVSRAGQPLDPGVRHTMETSLGHDFGDVHVHTDGAAAASARSVQAQAYTVGSHVVFGEGRYQPDSAEGRRTLAHELTHVVQQRQGPVDGTPAPGGIQVSHPGDRFEREAESVADRVVAAPAPEPAAGAAGPLVAREAEPAAETMPVQRQAAEEEEREEAPPPEAASEAPTETPAETEAPAEEQAAEGGAAPPAEEKLDEEESFTEG